MDQDSHAVSLAPEDMLSSWSRGDPPASPSCFLPTVEKNDSDPGNVPPAPCTQTGRCTVTFLLSLVFAVQNPQVLVGLTPCTPKGTFGIRELGRLSHSQMLVCAE